MLKNDLVKEVVVSIEIIKNIISIIKTILTCWDTLATASSYLGFPVARLKSLNSSWIVVTYNHQPFSHHNHDYNFNVLQNEVLS